MVVDTSALVAILLQEPEAAVLSKLISTSGESSVSAVSFVEASMVIFGRFGERGLMQLNALLGQGLSVVPVTAAQANIAVEAFKQFGKGHHPARLNLGDCFSYALARSLNRPLLYKGGDFALTDHSTRRTHLRH